MIKTDFGVFNSLSFFIGYCELTGRDYKKELKKIDKRNKKSKKIKYKFFSRN